MTRDDLRRFRALDIDFESIGLGWEGEFVPSFCTPLNAEYVCSIGCDGIHFILLPGDERVFCVSPTETETGDYVCPVAGNFREFLSFVLYCRDPLPLTDLWCMDKEEFYQLLKEDQEMVWVGSEEFPVDEELLAKKSAALSAIAGEFGLTPVDPFDKVKAMQEEFDPSGLNWSDEYYGVLGLERL